MRASAVVALLLGALVPIVAVHAQSTFEAASVKEHVAPGDGSFVGRQQGGRFGAQNASLREIIEYAYEIQGFQLAAQPGPHRGRAMGHHRHARSRGGAIRPGRASSGGQGTPRRSLRARDAP